MFADNCLYLTRADLEAVVGLLCVTDVDDHDGDVTVGPAIVDGFPADESCTVLRAWKAAANVPERERHDYTELFEPDDSGALAPIEDFDPELDRATAQRIVAALTTRFGLDLADHAAAETQGVNCEDTPVRT